MRRAYFRRISWISFREKVVMEWSLVMPNSSGFREGLWCYLTWFWSAIGMFSVWMSALTHKTTLWPRGMISIAQKLWLDSCVWCSHKVPVNSLSCRDLPAKNLPQSVCKCWSHAYGYKLVNNGTTSWLCRSALHLLQWKKRAFSDFSRKNAETPLSFALADC